MPTSATRYRWKGKVRLGFKGNRVVEVKRKGGRTHKVRRQARRK
jgi:hypothetical protein